MKEVMIAANYSPNTAKAPTKLTKSKAWPELMEQYLPDKKLAKVHKEGLEANKVITSPTEPDKKYPDYPTRHKYLETAYKIKKKVEEPPEKPAQELHLHLHQEKILQVVRKAEEEIKKQLET